MGATYTALPGWHSSCTKTAPHSPALPASGRHALVATQEGAGRRRVAQGVQRPTLVTWRSRSTPPHSIGFPRILANAAPLALPPPRLRRKGKEENVSECTRATAAVALAGN